MVEEARVSLMLFLKAKGFKADYLVRLPFGYPILADDGAQSVNGARALAAI